MFDLQNKNFANFMHIIVNSAHTRVMCTLAQLECQYVAGVGPSCFIARDYGIYQRKVIPSTRTITIIQFLSVYYQYVRL